MNTPTEKTKKAVAKKPAVKKAAPKKVVAKKPAVKKAAPKKAVTKKSAPKKAAFNPDDVGQTSTKNLKASSMDIDRQMKKISALDSRVLIAKDKLEEFQELLHERRVTFQEKNTAAAKRALENARKKLSNHKDFMTSIRETRADAAKMLKDTKSIHSTYESVVNHLEKSRVSAIKEAKKAEISFMKKLHQIEKKMLKKAEQLKKKILD
jgi:hypothetical protein